MSVRYLPTAILGLAILSGCPGFGDQTLEDLVAPSEVAPTWDNAVEQLLAENCAVCHTDPPQNGAPTGFRFDKFTTADIDDGGLQGAFEKRDRIFARAVNNEPFAMPPGSPLSLELKAVLGEWVMSGAPKSEGAAQ